MLDALTNIVASGFGAGISFLSGYIALSWTRLHRPDSARLIVKAGFVVALIVTGWFVVQGVLLDFISNARIVGFIESFLTAVNTGNIVFFFACLPVDALFIQAFRTKATVVVQTKEEPKVSKTKPLRHDSSPVQINLRTRTLEPIPEAQYKVSSTEVNPFEPLQPTKTMTEGKHTGESPTAPSSVAPSGNGILENISPVIVGLTQGGRVITVDSSLGDNILENSTPMIVGMTKGGRTISVAVHNSVLNDETPFTLPESQPTVETVQTDAPKEDPVCTEEKPKKKKMAPNSALVSHCHK